MEEEKVINAVNTLILLLERTNHPHRRQRGCSFELVWHWGDWMGHLHWISYLRSWSLVLLHYFLNLAIGPVIWENNPSFNKVLAGRIGMFFYFVYIHTSSSLKSELDTGLVGCGVEALAWGGFGLDLATEANRSCKQTIHQIIVMQSHQNKTNFI